MEISHRRIRHRLTLTGPNGEVAHLLAGLRRQKEELGPIADELIEMLSRFGAEAPGAEQAPVNPSSE